MVKRVLSETPWDCALGTSATWDSALGQSALGLRGTARWDSVGLRVGPPWEPRRAEGTAQGASARWDCAGRPFKTWRIDTRCILKGFTLVVIATMALKLWTHEEFDLSNAFTQIAPRVNTKRLQLQRGQRWWQQAAENRFASHHYHAGLDLPTNVVARRVALPASESVLGQVLQGNVWSQVLILLFLQTGFVQRVWKGMLELQRRFGSRVLQLKSSEEIYLLREALSTGVCLQHDLPLPENRTIKAGWEVLTPLEEIEGAKAPIRLRVRPGPVKIPQSGDSGALIFDLKAALKGLSCGVSPLIFWGWSQLAVRGVDRLCKRWLTDPRLIALQVSARLSLLSTFTACAWFVHLLISQWAATLSRMGAGAEHVGLQSSLREAQIHALRTLLLVLLWSLYTCAFMWSLGISMDKVLLIPGTTAVLIGWVGREIGANVMGGVVLKITQPFAQGDWVTFEKVDGWIHDIGTFYTKVVQLDKRPIYVPNFKLMTLTVQNNSRMTHRRVLFDLKLRIQDIPVIPQIVRDIQEMVNTHEDLETTQHHLVRWREIGEHSANIWVSCFTKPDRIGLGTYTATQQSVLERLAAIVYKHHAEFASTNNRNWKFGGEGIDLNHFGDSFGGFAALREGPGMTTSETHLGHSLEEKAREFQLQSREDVLRQRERDVKSRERQLVALELEKARELRELVESKEKLHHLLKEAVVSREAELLESPALADLDSKIRGEEALHGPGGAGAVSRLDDVAPLESQQQQQFQQLTSQQLQEHQIPREHSRQQELSSQTNGDVEDVEMGD